MKINLNLIKFKPLTYLRWRDFEELFAEHGVQKGCWCMYWRVKRNEFHHNYGRDNKTAIKKIVASGRIPGLIAYHGEKPIGWCSVAPREEFPVLDRSGTLKRIDRQPVWSIVCFFVSKPYRENNITARLIRAAIAYVKNKGGKIVEAYPIFSKNTRSPQWELYTGLVSTFKKLGFKIAARRSKVRPIMRLYLIRN